MKNYLITLLLFAFAANLSYAQSSQNFFLGIGTGLDYGGAGIRAEFQPAKNIGIIGGIGYNLSRSPGMNGGISYKLRTGKRITYHVAAIYGYNAVIRIRYNDGYTTYTDVQSYYGPSIGAGCTIYDKRKKNKLSLGIWVPFRSSDFKNRYEGSKDMGFSFHPDILPVTFTIGYNFSVTMNKKK